MFGNLETGKMPIGSMTKKVVGSLFFLSTVLCPLPTVLAQDQTTDITTNTGSATADADAGETHTVNITAILGDGDSNFRGYNDVVLDGSGEGQVIVNNFNRIGGQIDLSGISGGVEINLIEDNDPGTDFTPVWRFARRFVSGGDDSDPSVALASSLSSGDDLLNIDASGALIAGRPAISGPSAKINALDFGDGEDTFVNAGLIQTMASAGKTGNEGELRFVNLETFIHSGRIVFGNPGNVSGFGTAEEVIDRTEGWHDDVLLMAGTHFVGQGGELAMDVNLNGVGQSACDTSLRDMTPGALTNGDMPGADCLGLIGGSTEGITFIKANEVFPGDRGAHNPEGTVLVDVSGGESASGHFVLGENSGSYSPQNGGTIDKGAFVFALAYDAGNQQHKLVGLPSGNALQLPLLAHTGHSLWRLSTGNWLDRQADLRSNLPESGGGIWLRVSNQDADRDLVQTVSAFDRTLSFNNSYNQSSTALTMGLDLIGSVNDGTGFVAGLMAGYNHAKVDYDHSPNRAQFDGWSAGAYASYIAGGLFVDATVNFNRLQLDDDMPPLDLFPEGTILSTDLESIGGQLQAGWRFGLGGGPFDGLFVEPLAGLSYVKSDYDDMRIPAADPIRFGGNVVFDDPESLRAHAGGRIGLDQDYGVVRAQYSLLTRVWNESEGESRVTLENVGSDAVLSDKFDGTFTEVGLGASVFSPGGAVSGFINAKAEFGDDYDASNISAGVRVQW